MTALTIMATYILQCLETARSIERTEPAGVGFSCARECCSLQWLCRSTRQAKESARPSGAFDGGSMECTFVCGALFVSQDRRL